MTKQIVVVDSSEIGEGKLEELRRAVAELAEFVEANEPDPTSYQVFFTDDGRFMTVLQVHPDPESMERHMEIAGPVFARFADLLVLKTIDIYGSPSEKVLEHLRRKAELLGTATVTVARPPSGIRPLASPIVP